MSASSDVFKVLQITDCHLGAYAGHKLLGMDTDESLRRVIESATQHANIDLVLVSGDIADIGENSAYYRLKDMLAPLQLPSVWLCGNHDNIESLITSTGQANGSTGVVDAGSWIIVYLNSAVPGEVGGYLAEDQLQYLRSAIRRHPDKYILVSFHHQPIEVGCAWLDPQKVSNADELLAVIKSEDKVRAILWGHVHQEFYAQKNNVTYMATPSTCVQFLPNSADFAVDTAAPGYRIVELCADGIVKSQVYRIDASGLEVDLDSLGY